MFNFGGGGAFGSSQPQQSAFGTTPTTPAFGAAAPFGAQASPFGATQPAFGATQSAFGVSTPAFGASSAAAFGSSTFGARPATPPFGGFGASSSSPFGSTMAAFGASAPAFGATSAPAFGATSAPAFGATSAPAFGSTTFGASSSPFGLSTTFGASTPAFGQASSSPSLFGSSFGATSAAAFGSTSTGAFGAPASPFGAAPAGAPTGTRVVPYQKQVERDTSTTTGGNQQVNFMSISAMPQYNTKSVEELRWEDYQAGVKGGTGGGGGALGSPSFGSSFTAQSAAAPVFGTSTTFGSSPAASSAPFAFAPSTSSPFGAPASSPAFGSSIFGASSASPFGATSAPAFGSTTTPANPFGTTTSPFGVTSSGATTSPTQGFGASTGSIFGSTPNPQSSAFGFGTSTGSVFGAASSTSLFANTAAPSIFSASTGASTFGSTPTFSFNQPKPAGFGASSGSLFGPSTTAGAFSTGGFGLSTPAPAASPFGTPSLFGPTSTSSFATPGAFGSTPPQAQPPALNQAPYGTLAPLPTVSLPIPENKVGISQRSSSRPMSSVAARVSPLLRTQVPRSSPFTRKGPYSASPLFGKGSSPLALTAGNTGLTSTGLSTRGMGIAAAASPSPILPTRENPHSLFIREPPPGTEGAMTSGLTPTKTRSADWSPSNEEPQQQSSPSPRRFTLDTPAPSAPPPPSVPANGTTAANGHPAARPAQTSNGRPSSDNAAPSAPSVLPTLGNLAAQGYTMVPSRTQLQAMYDAEPESLASVHGFTVARPGFGEIRWLEPVDVRGLDLSEIVSIGKGEASLYLGQPDKPPVEEGLNNRAEVTLEGVYKMDKVTNQPIKEGPAVIQYEKRLRKHCASIDAKFIAYKPQGGFWKFEVAHWSRYAMPDESDEDEPGSQRTDEFMQGTQDKLGQAGPSTSSAGEQAGHLPAPLGADAAGSFMHSTDAAMMAGTEMEEDDADEEADGVGFMQAFIPPLQQTLPARLDLDASRLHVMKETLIDARLPGGRQALSLPLRAPGLPSAPVDSPPHNWHCGTPALSLNTPGPLLGSRSKALVLTPPSRLVTLPTPVKLFTPPSESGATLALTGKQDVSGLIVDAGMMMGNSFRAGWGPAGMFACSVPTPGSPFSTTIRLQPLPLVCNMGAAANKADMVKRYKQLLHLTLDVHRQHSYPGQGGPTPGDLTHAAPSSIPLASLTPIPTPGNKIHQRAADSSAPAVVAASGVSEIEELPASMSGDVGRDEGEPAGDVEDFEVMESERESLPAASLRGVREEDDDMEDIDGGGGDNGEMSEELLGYGDQGRFQEGESTDRGDGTEGEKAAESSMRGEFDMGGDVLDVSVGPVADPAAEEGERGLDDGLLQRTLGCQVNRLDNVVNSYVAVYRSVRQEHLQAASPLELATWGHAEDLWRLLAVLYGLTPSQKQREQTHTHRTKGAAKQRPVESTIAAVIEPSTVTSSSADKEADETASGLGEESSDGAVVIAMMERRAGLSRWLRGVVRSAMQQGLGSAEGVMQVVLQLMSGQQLMAAYATAAAQGDVRLASLLAKAGCHVSSKEFLSELQSVWHAAGILPQHVDTDRQVLLQLLAGDMLAAQPHMNLDWRRSFACFLWYACASTSDVKTVLQQYISGYVQEAALPRPLPLYQERKLAKSPTANPTDMQYELLCWYSQHNNMLTHLLRAAGHTPNPLDDSLSWHLLGVLAAIGAVPLDRLAAADEVYKLFSSMLLVLDTIGMSEWGVYVAMHLPDHPECGWLRERTITQLLERSWARWHGQEEKHAITFLRDVLRIPDKMLASAESCWLQYQRNYLGQCQALLRCEDWEAVHLLMWRQVAPDLVCDGKLEYLQTLLSKLEPHQASLVGWRRGGLVYLQYCRLRGGERGEAESEEVEVKELLDLEANIQDAIQTVSQLEASGCLHKYCRRVLLQMAESVHMQLIRCSSLYLPQSDQPHCSLAHLQPQQARALQLCPVLGEGLMYSLLTTASYLEAAIMV